MSVENEIRQLNTAVSELKRTTDENAEKLDSIGGTVSKISFYLYDDTQTSGKGLVSQVREHALRILKLEEINKIRDARASVWGVVGGAVAVGFLKLIFWLASVFFK